MNWLRDVYCWLFFGEHTPVWKNRTGIELICEHCGKKLNREDYEEL